MDDKLVDSVETAMDTPTALVASKNLERIPNLSTGQRARVASLWIDQLHLELEETEHKLYVLLSKIPSDSLNDFLTKEQSSAVKHFCNQKLSKTSATP